MRLSMEAILADACSTSSLVDSDSGAEAAAGGSGSACMNNGVARRGFIASFGAPASWKALHDAQNTKRSAAKVLILCFGLFDRRPTLARCTRRNEGRDDCVLPGGGYRPGGCGAWGYQKRRVGKLCNGLIKNLGHSSRATTTYIIHNTYLGTL
jgi:hypothetical protein